MVKEKLLKILKAALERSGIKEEEIELEHPASLDHGDYSTNIALKLSKKLNKNPQELAEEIVAKIEKGDVLEKVEVVKPGFINFFLSKKILLEELNRINQEKDDYGKKPAKNFKILLEYGQPNTHKTPHIGHLFSYIYGESLARILETEGNKIFRANYQGDVGLHVAKCLYVVLKKQDQIKDLKSPKEKVDFLQKCYVEGDSLYEKDKKIEKEIDQLNLKIYQKDSSVMDLWKETRNWSLDFYKAFEKRLGIKYDKYYFESETSQLGKKITEENLNKVFKKSEAATIFKGEKYGLHTRVFVNKFGNPTYEAKDLGLISLKKKDFPFDLSIVTTASEQNEYWKVVIKVSELIFTELKNQLKHLGFGMINLTTGKMSSRKGVIVDAFSLITEVKEEIKKSYKVEDALAEKISQAAIKHSFLKSDVFKNIAFDLKTSISREGDSGPYLLYTYVRTKSLLKNQTLSTVGQSELNPEEENILRSLYLYPEIVEKTATIYSPHLIANYLFNLAQKFNLFYERHPILKSANKEFRLTLSAVVGQVIKNGLRLLGIEVVEKM